MSNENVLTRIIVCVLKFFKILEKKEISNYEMCKQAQDICNNNCNSCLWGQDNEK